MRALFLSLFVWLFLSCLPISSLAWQGTIMNVYDGDTITVAPFGDETCPLFIRLYGIDAPELAQEGGNDARLWLAGELALKSPVDIITMGVDGHGRLYGLVAKNGKIINGQAIALGHAWVWKERCQAMVCRSWAREEQKARDGSKGIWQKKNAVAPWQWRQTGTNQSLQPVPGGTLPFGLDPGTILEQQKQPKPARGPQWIPFE